MVNNYCAVSGCIKESYPGCGISFHKLPANRELRKKWIKVIPDPGTLTNSSVICSLHFQLEDYRMLEARKRLKPGVIPSIFPTLVKKLTSTLPENKNERESDDIPQDTPDLVGFPTESESTAAAHELGGAIKAEPVDPALVVIKKEPHSGYKNNEINNEPSELSEEGSFNIYDMKFEIDEEGPVRPSPDTEMVTKQEKDVSKGQQGVPYNTYHMKFEIDEEGPVRPAPDTEMVTKQEKDVSKGQQGVPYNTYHMKFEIDEEDPVRPAPDTEMVTKQQKDVSKDVTSMQTSVAAKLKTATGSTTKRKHRKTSTRTSRGPHRCDVCQRRFTLHCNLMQHYRIHTGEKPFACDYCGRSFNQKSHVISHIRTHSREHPFQCKECGCRYKNKTRLSQHMKSAHTVKIVMCEVCQHTFSLKCDLLIHMRTHIGEKLLKCNKCQREFSDKETISRHLRTCIGNEPCPKKPFRFCLEN